MIQEADEQPAEGEGEHPEGECKNRGNLKVLPGKREGNHPDRADQREHEQDREKKDAEENQNRLEISKNCATSHARSSINLNRQNPSAGNPEERLVCGGPESPDVGIGRFPLPYPTEKEAHRNAIHGPDDEFHHEERQKESYRRQLQGEDNDSHKGEKDEISNKEDSEGPNEPWRSDRPCSSNAHAENLSGITWFWPLVSVS